MRGLMADDKQRLREHAAIRYSQELLNNFFCHPYTRIEFLQNDLGSRCVRQSRDTSQIFTHVPAIVFPRG